jgi:hypothetical protein
VAGSAEIDGEGGCEVRGVDDVQLVVVAGVHGRDVSATGTMTGFACNAWLVVRGAQRLGGGERGGMTGVRTRDSFGRLRRSRMPTRGAGSAHACRR